MELKLKSRTILLPLTFTHPLTSLACHGVRMFVWFWPTWYLFLPIFWNIAATVTSAIQDCGHQQTTHAKEQLRQTMWVSTEMGRHAAEMDLSLVQTLTSQLFCQLTKVKWHLMSAAAALSCPPSLARQAVHQRHLSNRHVTHHTAENCYSSLTWHIAILATDLTHATLWLVWCCSVMRLPRHFVTFYISVFRNTLTCLLWLKPNTLQYVLKHQLHIDLTVSHQSWQRTSCVDQQLQWSDL